LLVLHGPATHVPAEPQISPVPQSAGWPQYVTGGLPLLLDELLVVPEPVPPVPAPLLLLVVPEPVPPVPAPLLLLLVPGPVPPVPALVLPPVPPPPAPLGWQLAVIVVGLVSQV
jgi:hypothetical protein